jgi:hypothetical protein
MYNKDVPPEAIARQLIKENKQLKVEINILKDEINNLKNAITAFKKWQSKVALYKYKYWLAEGLKFVNEGVDLQQIETLRRFFGQHTVYSRWLKKCTNAMESMIKEGEKLKKYVKEDE